MNLLNLPGWRTNRKIVVFESDDWGSIRMPSKEIYDELIKKNIPIHTVSFNRYDSLASESDLSALFEVLYCFKDKNGNPPVITANTIVANPDFEKIEQSHFQEYFYEPFTKTLKSYPDHQNAFKIWQQGIKEKIFHPQFHGREHLNVCRWLRTLNSKNNENIRLAFENRLFDLSESANIITKDSFMDAYSYEDQLQHHVIENSIKEGLELFHKIFGYHSKSFVAPCYIWDSSLEIILKQNGVKFIKGGYFQKQPIQFQLNQFNRKFHYTGQRNQINQIYLIRNCFFEPSDNIHNNHVNLCLNRIENAFKWNKPAIVNTHRVNFIGSICLSIRDKNLLLLKKLLSELIKKNPEVEFLTGDQLGETILKD